MRHVNGYDKSLKTEDIVRRYQDGESVYSIAKSLGKSQSTIIYRLKQSGVYESNAERIRREKELAGFNCSKEFNTLNEAVNEHKSGSLMQLAEFIYEQCSGCEYLTWRCEKCCGGGK